MVSQWKPLSYMFICESVYSSLFIYNIYKLIILLYFTAYSHLITSCSNMHYNKIYNSIVTILLPITTSKDKVSTMRISALCLFKKDLHWHCEFQALPVCGLSQSESRDDERGRIPIFNTQGTDTSTPVTGCSSWRTTNALYLSLQMLKTVRQGTGLLIWDPRRSSCFVGTFRVLFALNARGEMDRTDVFIMHWTCEDASGHLIFLKTICVTLSYAENKCFLIHLHNGDAKEDFAPI